MIILIMEETFSDFIILDKNFLYKYFLPNLELQIYLIRLIMGMGSLKSLKIPVERSCFFN